MTRPAEHITDVALLDDLAGVHDRHAIGDLRNDAQVVADEDHRHTQPPLQVGQQIDDLGLYGDVEGGGRLIRDEDGGLACQRHGDHRPLLHPTRELVRIRIDALLGIGEAYELEHLDGARSRFARVGAPVDANRFRDLVAHGPDGVEARHRLLEDHRDLVAADRFQLPQR